MSKELQSLIIKIDKSHWEKEKEKKQINRCIDKIVSREQKLKKIIEIHDKWVSDISMGGDYAMGMINEVLNNEKEEKIVGQCKSSVSKELYQDYINGLSISELANKYKVSKTRVYKEIAEYSKEQGKVLKIIKEKNVDIYIFNDLGTLEEYNEWVLKKYGTYYQLTQEEFNLLKRC